MFRQPFNNWLDGAREDLVDMFIVHTMEEIQGLIEAHEQFKATLGEADKEYNSVVNLVKEVEMLARQYQIPGGLENPYTSLTANVSHLATRRHRCRQRGRAGAGSYWAAGRRSSVFIMAS